MTTIYELNSFQIAQDTTPASKGKVADKTSPLPSIFNQNSQPEYTTMELCADTPTQKKENTPPVPKKEKPPKRDIQIPPGQISIRNTKEQIIYIGKADGWGRTLNWNPDTQDYDSGFGWGCSF